MVDYHKTMKLGRKLLDKYGLVDWSFDVRNLRNTAMYEAMFGPDCDCALGFCHHEQKTIYVDFHAQQRMVRQIILHEVAHALTPGYGHGEAWWQKASDIGCTFVSLLPYSQQGKE